MLRMHEPVVVSARTRVSPVIFSEAPGPGMAVLFLFRRRHSEIEIVHGAERL
jgi:hypothetical protein